MPLVKIFGTGLQKINLSMLHSGWCKAFKVPPSVLQIILNETPTDAMFPQKLLVDVRAKRKADRTP